MKTVHLCGGNELCSPTSEDAEKQAIRFVKMAVTRKFAFPVAYGEKTLDDCARENLSHVNRINAVVC